MSCLFTREPSRCWPLPVTASRDHLIMRVGLDIVGIMHKRMSKIRYAHLECGKMHVAIFYTAKVKDGLIYDTLHVTPI